MFGVMRNWTSQCISRYTLAPVATTSSAKCKNSSNINQSVMALLNMHILVACTKINYVFEKLEKMGVVCEEDKYEKWLACYDFEMYQRDFHEGIDQVEELDLEEGVPRNKMHVPVSFSVGCNLKGVETVHVSCKDPEELTAKLVGRLFEMADKKYRAAVERFEYIFEQIDDLMHKEHHLLAEMNGDMVVSVVEFLDNAGDDDLEMDKNGGLTSKHMKSLENLFGKLEGYCKEFAVFGFNSAGFDIKLIKKYLIYSKNCVNMVSNLILLSIKLESILVSRLNT